MTQISSLSVSCKIIQLHLAADFLKDKQVSIRSKFTDDGCSLLLIQAYRSEESGYSHLKKSVAFQVSKRLSNSSPTYVKFCCFFRRQFSRLENLLKQHLYLKPDITLTIFMSNILRSCNKIMNNKIALVNRDLHTKLFQAYQQHQENEAPRIYRRHPLPPQLMLKNMIKKGLTSTQQQFHSRPKTATSRYLRSQGKTSLNYLRPSQMPELKRASSVNKKDAQTQSRVDFTMNFEHPQGSCQLQQVLKQLKSEREHEGVRKRLKLQNYGLRKFNYAWKKYNIPC